jgi:multidrug efflux pump subunit AcrA (membrane-fusion protein)
MISKATGFRALVEADPTQISLSERWPAGRPLTTGTIGLLVLICGFGGWASFASVSGAVIASGRIEVEQNRQVIQHPFGGVVDQIIVKEGDHVRVGDLLIRLDAAELRSELAIVEGWTCHGLVPLL